ncbi:MAG TPA: GNAT family N-acetyltransferase [Thermoanaerobaculia bacterium]|nr:GNAT family N-acetyltransferase [Thermoanaerobaculia bacterium]
MRQPSEPGIIEVRLLGTDDGEVLTRVAPDVFDLPIQPHLAAEFLADPRHHLAVACDAGRVVGFASAVHYIHPDKPAELWVNEVGVSPAYQRRGLGKRLLFALFEAGRAAGCRSAWVLTDSSNRAAQALYSAAGGSAAADRPVMFEISLADAAVQGTEELAPARALDRVHAPRPGVREMQPGEAATVGDMMQRLWPEAGDYDFSDEHVFVWEREGGELGGFVSFSLRPWAEGCVSAPVPYIEGWWVAPDLRGQGVGTKLVEAVEQWCRSHGYEELGSDVEFDNEVSQRAHAALGFSPTLRLQFFRKRLA